MAAIAAFTQPTSLLPFRKRSRSVRRRWELTDLTRMFLFFEFTTSPDPDEAMYWPSACQADRVDSVPVSSAEAASASEL